jgi:allantoinase
MTASLFYVLPNSSSRLLQQDAIAVLTGLATTMGAPIHIAHVSDADSLGAVAAARGAGKRITAETCTHYLTFAAEAGAYTRPLFSST